LYQTLRLSLLGSQNSSVVYVGLYVFFLLDGVNPKEQKSGDCCKRAVSPVLIGTWRDLRFYELIHDESMSSDTSLTWPIRVQCLLLLCLDSYVCVLLCLGST